MIAFHITNKTLKVAHRNLDSAISYLLAEVEGNAMGRQWGMVYSSPAPVSFDVSFFSLFPYTRILGTELCPELHSYSPPPHCQGWARWNHKLLYLNILLRHNLIQHNEQTLTVPLIEFLIYVYSGV